MPSPQAWAREAERYQRVADLRREQEQVAAQTRRLRRALFKNVLRVVVLLAVIVLWVLWLVGVFR